MDEREIDEALQNNVKEGLMIHKGFDKEGRDLFSLSKEGIKYSENLIISSPETIMFFLQLGQSNGKKAFFSSLKQICKLLKEKEDKK